MSETTKPSCACRHEIHYDYGKFCIDSPEGEECLCMNRTPAYVKEFGPEKRSELERMISQFIKNMTTVDEDLSTKMTQEIVRQVIFEFRPDLFESNKE